MPKAPNFTPYQRGNGRWVVDIPLALRLDGKKQRTFKPTDDQAAFSFAAGLRRKWLGLSQPDAALDQELLRLAVLRDSLAQHGKTLYDAACHYLDHLQNHPATLTVEGLVALVDSTIDDRLTSSLVSSSHAGSLRLIGRRAVEHFGADRTVATITAPEIEKFMLHYRPGRRGYKAWRPKVAAWFSFAVKHRALAENPVKFTTRPATSKSVQILTIADAQAIIDTFHPPSMTRYDLSDLTQFLVRLFTGMRWSEAQCIRRRHIDTDEGVIYLDGETTKTTADRFVTIHPPLRAFFESSGILEQPPDYVLSPCHPYHRMQTRTTAAGVAWSQSILRHTCASHHWVAFRDRNAVMAELGHEIDRTTFTHYITLLKPTAAKAFFDAATWRLPDLSAAAPDILTRGRKSTNRPTPGRSAAAARRTTPAEPPAAPTPSAAPRASR